jgi:hypothetical protein
MASRNRAAAGKAKAAAESVATAPAVPYVPTEQEAAAVAAQRARRAARAPRPKMKTTLKKLGDKSYKARIEVDHADGTTGHDLLAASLASTDWDFTRLMLAHLTGLATPQETVEGAKARDDRVLSGNLAIVQAIEPQNEVETMLAVQMAAIHGATMQMACNIRIASNADRVEQLERSMNRLARTFTTQMEALKRYRSKGEQRVVVEHQHVHVYPGGQAVVGTLNQGGEAGAENGNGVQSHGTDRMLLPERSAMLGTIEADGLPMPSTCGEGQERVQVPRGARRGALRAA